MPTTRTPVDNTPDGAASPRRGLAAGVVRHRVIVCAVWAVVATGSLPFAAGLGHSLDVSARVLGSEAAAVDHAMTARLDSPFAEYAILVVGGVPAPDTPAGRAVLDTVLAAVDTISGVTRTLSYSSDADSLFVGEDAATGSGGTFIIVGLRRGARGSDEMVPRLRGATASLAPTIAKSHPRATLRWTGTTPINFDIRTASTQQAHAAERNALPVTLLLLVLAFGGIVAALVPLAAAGIAIVVTLGFLAALNHVLPLSIAVQNIVSMIGLGVGIDYALLTVSRFREARSAGLEPISAAIDAATHAATTITLSAIAVCVGFAALIFVPLNELRSIGIGGLMVVASSVLVALTLTPALLVILAHRIDGSRSPRRVRMEATLERRWRAWGAWVVRRPMVVLITASIPLLALAWQGTRLNAELPRGNWLPTGIESGLALGDLQRMKRGGIVGSIRMFVETPSDLTLLDARVWRAVRSLTDTIAADPRVRRVSSITRAVSADSLSFDTYATLAPPLRDALLSQDLRATVLEVLPVDSLDFNALTALARDLRLFDNVAIDGVPTARLHVRAGGMPAFNADYTDAIAVRLPRIVALVVLATLVALSIGFRSVLIPIKAVALNLLSVGAACGALVLVFQDGHGARVVGLNEGLGGVFPVIPILVFSVVFGLSMDYEVFLVSRVAELRRTMSDRDAIVEGLARTGGVITSAAAVMIVVFGAFALGDFQFIKMLGFALAIAVFIDATIVRMAIGPALLTLAGRWNWWPGRPPAAYAAVHTEK